MTRKDQDAMPIHPIDAKLFGLLALLLGSCSSAAMQSPDAAPPACYPSPMTHLEIINSCADVTTYDKPAQLPKLAPGAPLMPLP